MGPMLMFDKSTLQSLSLDEAIWLDGFFMCNITPLFFIETLADLELGPEAERPPTKIISELAEKTPAMASYLNTNFYDLLMGDLLGYPVEMSGRPILRGGQLKVDPDGKFGFHFGTPPEVQALDRWEKGEYLAVEREFAKQWRQTLSAISFDSIIGTVKNVVPSGVNLNSPGVVKKFVDQFVRSRDVAVLNLAFILLGIPEALRMKVLVRWVDSHRLPFDEFAPYTSYVFRVDLFFYLCLSKSFISKERRSNKIDIAYLYYLPFCRVFVSSDDLHARVAPLFMEHGQMFVRGQDFKTTLAQTNEYFSKLPEQEREKGVFKLATYPPTDFDNLITAIWDKFYPSWRRQATQHHAGKTDLPSDPELLKHLNKIEKESIAVPGSGSVSTDQADHVIFQRNVRIKKGNWRILPKEVENEEKNGVSQ